MKTIIHFLIAIAICCNAHAQRADSATYTWSNGDVYNGWWKNGQRNGYGEYTCGPGRCFDGIKKYVTYKGYWTDNKRNGIGTICNREGKKMKSGLFINDIYQPKRIITTDSFSDFKSFNSVFIEPVALADLYNGGSFRLGAEHRAGKKWAVVATMGVYCYFSKGWIAKGEVKRYVTINQPGYKGYASLEYYYKNTYYNTSDSIFHDPDHLAHFTITKYITGMRLKIGAVQLCTHNIMFEWYGGIGVRYRNAASTLPDYEYQYIKYGDETGREDRSYTNAISKTIRPDVTAGIRIGFRY